MVHTASECNPGGHLSPPLRLSLTLSLSRGNDWTGGDGKGSPLRGRLCSSPGFQPWAILGNPAPFLPGARGNVPLRLSLTLSLSRRNGWTGGDGKGSPLRGRLCSSPGFQPWAVLGNPAPFLPGARGNPSKEMRDGNRPSEPIAYLTDEPKQSSHYEGRKELHASHGRSRLSPPARIFLAMMTSSVTWKSNIPTQRKSAPFSKAY